MNANQIKLLAITAMTVDHLAWLLFPGYPRQWLPLLMHAIGRITCPIMCYFIAEGYHHTGNLNRYMGRLFVFAVVSHFAYRFAFLDFAGWRSMVPFWDGAVLNQTGVLWPFAWGLVMLRVVHSSRITGNWKKVLLVLLICVIAFPGDWSCVASLCILAMGTNRGNFKAQMGWMVLYVAIYAVVYFFAIDRVYGLLQMAVVLAVPVLHRYNGQRGKCGSGMKWLFYLYYPLHLFAMGCIRYWA